MDNVYWTVGLIIVWTVTAAAGIALLGLLIAAAYGTVTAWRASSLWIGFRILDYYAGLDKESRESLNKRLNTACEATGFEPSEKFYQMIEKLRQDILTEKGIE
jgi:hypothetical protein